MSYDVSNYAASQQQVINTLINKVYGYPADSILTSYVNGEPANAATFNARQQQMAGLIAFLLDANRDEETRAQNAETVLLRRVGQATRAVTAVASNALIVTYAGTMLGTTITLTTGESVLNGKYQDLEAVDYGLTFTNGTSQTIVAHDDGSVTVEAGNFVDTQLAIVVGYWDGSVYTPRPTFQQGWQSINAVTVSGDGAGLTNLNASELTHGQVNPDVLPLAGTTTSGTVKVGSNLTIDGDGTIHMTAANVIAALGYTPENLANKGVASGYAPLGADGLIPDQYMPPISITETHVVADEAAMLALDAQKGDVAIRTDEGNKSYILKINDPTILGNWEYIGASTIPVTSVDAVAPMMVNSTTGNISISFQNQAASSFLAGPISGPDGAPVFRSIEVSDLPTIPTSKGGTGATTAIGGFNALSPLTTLGDTLYHNGTNNTRLAGNVTTTRKFLRQTGTGAVSAAPAWDVLQSGDLPKATTAAVGGVKVGSNLTVDASGVISLTAGNVTGALGYTPLNAAGGTISGNLLVSGILSAGSTSKALTAADGTILDAALSSNVALKDQANVFGAINTFSQYLKLATGQLRSDNAFAFVTYLGTAQTIKSGGMLVSSDYADVTNVPANGAYIKGQVWAAGGFKGDGSLITGLDGGNIATGTIASARLPLATTTTVGGVKAGSGLAVDGTGLLTNADKGSSQNIFKNIANASGTTQFSAGGNNDTLRLAGSGIALAFDAATNKVTFTNSGVLSFNTRTGAITLTSSDVTGALGYTPADPGAAAVNFAGDVSANSLTASKAQTKGLILGTAASGSRFYSTSAGVDDIDATTLLTGLTAGAGISVTGAGHSRAIANTGILSVSATAPIVVSTTNGAASISVNDATTNAKGVMQVGSGLSVASGVVANADKGSSQNIFKSIKNGSGVPQFAASSNSDFLAFEVGAGLSVAFDGMTRKITYTNTGVLSFNTRTGAVTLTSGDVTGALGYTPANVAGSTFTGQIRSTANYHQIDLGAVGQAGSIAFRRGPDAAVAGYVGYTTANENNNFRIWAAGGGGYLTLHVGSSASPEKARVLGDGKFLIGRTADDGTGYLLQVAGYVSATGFKGDGSGLTNIQTTALSGTISPSNLPKATAAAIGAVQIGSNLSIDANGVISLSAAGVTGALGYTPENVANKGAINGYASLGADGKIPESQLPALVITDTFVVADQAAMLAVNAQKGDIAVRSDLRKTYILKDVDPTVLTNWQELYTPTDSVLSVNGKTGAVTLSTTDIAEGTNLYWTNSRFDTRLASAGLNASNINSGTVAAAYLPSAVAWQNGGNIFTVSQTISTAGQHLVLKNGTKNWHTEVAGTGANRFQIVETGVATRLSIAPGGAATYTGSFAATSFSGDGSALTNLNGSNIATGTLADARLSTNVPLKNAANNFTQNQTFGNTAAGNLVLRFDEPNPKIRWYSGATAKGQILTDVTNSIIYMDASGGMVFRSAVDSGGALFTLTGSGNATFLGGVTATSFSGAGGSLTSLNASNISSGALDDARLSLELRKRLEHTTDSFLLGNNDWSGLAYYANAGLPVYDEGYQGMSFTAVTQWVHLRVRMPVDPDSVYYCRAKVRKVDGDGTFYIGAKSLDNNYNELKTDTANAFNYFTASGVSIGVGNTQIFEGTISGYNAAGAGDSHKFDPEAKYFDLVILCNYNGTAIPQNTVVEWVELWRIPNEYRVSGDLTVGGILYTGSDSTQLTDATGKVMHSALPVATGATVGGIKVGPGLAIDGNGLLSTSGQAVGTGSTSPTSLTFDIDSDNNSTAERFVVRTNGATEIFAIAEDGTASITGDGKLVFGPNSTWNQSLVVGGNGHIDSTKASVVTTNGNLHLDAKNGSATYLNHYAGSIINFGDGSAAVKANFRTSGLRLGDDLAATEMLDVIGNGKFSGDLTSVNGIFRSDSPFKFVTSAGESAQQVMAGSLLVSNVFDDASKVPANGAYIKGGLKTGNAFIQDAPAGYTDVLRVYRGGSSKWSLSTDGGRAILTTGLSVEGVGTNATGASVFKSPVNTIAATFGDGSATGLGANEWGGAFRFNGSGVAWGDMAFFPTGGDAGEMGHFRLSITGSALNYAPNAKLGVGELFANYKVGIGTTSPTEALDVAGNGKFSGTLTTGGPVIVPDAPGYMLNIAGDLTWGLYWDKTDNQVHFKASGVTKGYIDLDDGVWGGSSLMSSNNFQAAPVNGSGYRFWASEDFKIWMSGAGDASLGGRLDPSSDYNMYFRMVGVGKNRGFVWMGGDEASSSHPIAALNPDGFRTAVDVLVGAGHKVETEAVDVKASGSTKRFKIEYNETDDSLDFVFSAS